MSAPLLSIVTPWRNAPELIPAYERAVSHPGVEVIIIDNGSAYEPRWALVDLRERLEGKLSALKENVWFAAACNHGLERATGEYVLMLNNDIEADDSTWLDVALADMRAHHFSLCGPSLAGYHLAGVGVLSYLEGWCLAASRPVWDKLRGFDAERFRKPYGEDVDLCFRARLAGIPLVQTRWKVRHLGNYTSQRTPGAYDAADANRQGFDRWAREALSRLVRA